ncbi:aminopeptidase N-like [Haematobia irritans]|uniref:aminopeptidase N-like n=1 Tax=Haematobia irritans TaxID=7368 RepID=UPI003F4F727C
MGLMGYDQIFDCMEYLATELEYVPWQPAFKAFETLGQRLTLNQHEKFGEFLFDILDSLYKKLGFDYNAKDSILDIYNRNKAISWLCRYHHSDCNAKAQYHFKSTESGNVPTDFQESLYCAAIREAQFDIYSALKDKYMHETNEIQKEKILRAMGCTQHYVEFHFAFILTSDVSEETKPSAIASLYSQTPENVDEVYQALTETFEIEILQNILGGWSVLASVISDLANYFTTQSQLDSLKDFIEMKGDLFGSSRYILENAVPKAEANLAWSAKHLASLFEYLDQRNGASAINSALSLLPLWLTLTKNNDKFLIQNDFMLATDDGDDENDSM